MLTAIIVGFAATPALFAGASVYAQEETLPVCAPDQDPEEDDCRKIEHEIITDPALEGGGNDLIEKYINPLINFLSAVVGIVIVISFVVGGIQYASSEDDPQKVKQAKSRIINAILALLAFLFLYAFLQWLVPGGF